MKISSKISLVKFLKLYYNIPGSKTKYFRHKHLKYLFPELKCIQINDFEIINMNVSLGKWLMISDCEGEIMYYENPFYNQDKLDEEVEDTLKFEDTDEFMSAPIYHRFKYYEEVDTNDEYDIPLIDIPIISNEELSNMKKWELIELKKKLESNNKISMGAYYVLIAKIKKELSIRRKEEIEKRRIYVRKKENRQND